MHLFFLESSHYDSFCDAQMKISDSIPAVSTLTLKRNFFDGGGGTFIAEPKPKTLHLALFTK